MDSVCQNSQAYYLFEIELVREHPVAEVALRRLPRLPGRTCAAGGGRTLSGLPDVGRIGGRGRAVARGRKGVAMLPGFSRS